MSNPSLSILIAAYNSASWLPSTLRSLELALHESNWDAEIVIVDDGSTDGTVEVLNLFQKELAVPLKIVSTINQGRFLARWTGAQAATSQNLLIFDSRILMGIDSLRVLGELHAKRPKASWNAHIITDPNSASVGLFWEVPVRFFWRKYLRNPKQTLYTKLNFDLIPKGTTAFFVNKQLFLKACEFAWPDRNAHLTSDDTKLIRFISQQENLYIDPKFTAIYRPRANFSSFLKHAYVRGTLFVDSYAATSLFRNLVLIFIGLFPLILLLAGLSQFWIQNSGFLVFSALAALLMMIFIMIGMPLLAFIAGVSPGFRAIKSFITYAIPFSAVFWAGIFRGIIIHRRNFFRIH